MSRGENGTSEGGVRGSHLEGPERDGNERGLDS